MSKIYIESLKVLTIKLLTEVLVLIYYFALQCFYFDLCQPPSAKEAFYDHRHRVLNPSNSNKEIILLDDFNINLRGPPKNTTYG